MKIGIDISQIVYDTGVSVYTRELVAHLIKNFPEEDYVLFGGSLRRKSEIKDFVLGFKSAKSVITPISPSIADFLWNKMHILPIESFIGKVDIFHSSDWAEPASNACKVTTIHDLSFIKYPKLTDPKILQTHKRRLYWVSRESDSIIVPSESTKSDAVKIGIAEKKIHIIHEAPSQNFKKQSSVEVEKVMKKYRISANYALGVGNSPRKNTKRIINAFQKVKMDCGLKELIIVGRGKTSEDRGVKFLGHVQKEDLPALYSGARLLIYTSIYEGFGLPILEAFSCHCPVLTSNISSMPETAGNACVLADPFSVSDIANGVVKTLENSENLIAKGKERVKNFSWDEIAKKTMSVYREIGN